MEQTDQRFTLSLHEAFSIWKQEPGAPVNAYNWYRKDAQRDGFIDMGARVAVRKQGHAWMVDADGLKSAIQAHRDAVAKTAAVTEAYKRHRLTVGPGESETTTWGGYQVRKDFHQTWSNKPMAYGGGMGSWFCNICFAPAKTERNRDECHTCSDWGNCGRDCRLSRVFCPGCGTSMDV